MFIWGVLLLFFILIYCDGDVGNRSYQVFSDKDGEIYNSTSNLSFATQRDAMMLNFKRIFERQCDFDIYSGTCVITSVTPNSDNNFANIFLDFIDSATNEVTHNLKYILFLVEPSLEYVRTHNITTNSKFACKKKVSKSGLCEPVYVTFDVLEDLTFTDSDSDLDLKDEIGKIEL